MIALALYTYIALGLCTMAFVEALRPVQNAREAFALCLIGVGWPVFLAWCFV